MKEKRSLFNMIFGNKKQQDTGNYLQLISGYNPVFSSNNVSTNNIVTACIDTIASHAAKMLPQHIKKTTNSTEKIYGEINHILSTQPNPIMTTYDFIYKTVSILYSKNNVFIYINKDKKGMIQGFYPLHPDNCTLLEVAGKIILRFQFVDGNTYRILYDDVIHLRRFYNEHDIYGEDNETLKGPIQTSNTVTEGIGNAIKTSMALKGVIRYTNAMLKEKDIKSNRDQFVEDFIRSTNNGSGIAALDSKAEFQELNLKPITLDNNQLTYINNNIFYYFRVNEKIISGNFTDEEWNAFFESVIEPLAIQMSDAFTNKIFSQKAIKEGHQIIFEVNRIQYAKTATKINLLKETSSLGLITIDEGREILGLPMIGGEEGKKRLQSLNYINQDIADSYQGGKIDGKVDTGNKNSGNESDTE